MKKVYSLLLAASIAASCITPVCAEDIRNLRLNFDGRKLTVTANVDKVGGNYAVMIVKDGGTAANPGDVFAAAETKSMSDKTISCSVVMPDEKNGVKTDGKYVLYVKGKDSSIEQYPFDYVTEEGKNAARSELMTANESELIGLFAQNSAKRAAHISCGLVFDEYDNFSDAEKAEACVLFKNSRTESTLAADFNKSVILAKINTSASIGEWLEKSDMQFEGTAYRDSAAKDFIIERITAARKFADVKSFEETYELANILYLLNNANYNEIGGLLEKYSNQLDISNNPSYIAYVSLGAEAKQAANETMVLKLSKNRAVSVNDVKSAIADGVSVVSNSGGNSGGTTGGKANGSKISIGTSTPASGGDVVTEDGFIDLSGFSWAEKAIKSLYRKNIVSGVGDNKFDPYGKITREAFVKMIVSAKNKHNSSAKSTYSDVENGAWYESYVASANDENIISGIGDNLFGVGFEIKRQDAAVIIAKCLEIADTDSNYKFNDDAEIADYAKQAVYNLYNAKIISGTDNGLFDPNGSLTRAQAAVMIYNMLSYNPETKITEDEKTVSKYADKVNMLKAFGFLKGIETESFDDSASMNAGKFVTSVVAMITDGSMDDSQAASYAKNAGIISDDFDLSGAISYEAAASILVGVLGYGKLYADRSMSEAATAIGLLYGVAGEQGKALKMGSAVVMLCNALEIPLVTIDNINADNISVTSDSDNTILSVYHDYYEIEGIISANEYTSISGSSVSVNTVRIDGTAYLIGNTNADKLIGRNIKAWAYIPSTGSDDSKLMYVEEYKNNVTEIKADLIDNANETQREIEYLETKDSAKTKKVKISPVVKVLYNGKIFDRFSYSDFNIKSGRLVLIDNDNDNTADVVLIETYKFMVTDSISYTNEAIYNIYKTPERLDINEDDGNITVYLNEEKTEYTNLPEKSVLSIMSSKDGELITIEASDKTIGGKITAIDGNNDKIAIDGTEYELSQGYLDAKAANDPKCTAFKVGNTYTFYLDSFGDVAYAEEGTESTYQYVYAKKFVYEDSSLDETCSLRAFTTDSKWETLKLAEKVKYNKSRNLTRQEVFDELGGANLTKQLLQIKVNSNGEISAINTAENRGSYVNSDFNKREVTGIWGVNNFSFSSKIFTFDNTKVIRIPTSENADEDEYSITSRSMFVVDNGYTITAYDVDNFNYSKIITVQQNETIGENALPFVVANVSKKDSEGDILPVITGIIGENAEYSIAGKDSDTFDGIKKGDVIQLSIGANGKARKYNPLFTASRYGEKINPAEINKASNDVAGNITDIDRSGGRIKIDTGAEGGMVLLKRESTKVALYDMKRDTVKEISFAELEKDDYVYARLEWSKVNLIYAIRR
mgnify:CR=1 FL=1